MVKTTVATSWLLAIVCTPSCIAATTLNILFIFCICRPADGARIQQPLQFFLTVMLSNSTIHQLIVMISVILSLLTPPDWLLAVNGEIFCQTFSSSFSTCAWISIVYYLKIVPQHHVIFIWMKKNIKAIVFAGFVFDQVLLLSAVTMNTLAYMLQTRNDNSSETSYLNGTIRKGIPALNHKLYESSNSVYLAYFTCPLITLTFSWGRTFYYLLGHIKKMEQTSSSSCKQQRKQMRVTIMGIVQTAVFIPSSLWVITTVLLISSEHKTSDDHYFIMMTITSVCGLANILCLGFSQNVFRVRIISSFKRFKKAFGM